MNTLYTIDLRDPSYPPRSEFAWKRCRHIPDFEAVEDAANQVKRMYHYGARIREVATGKVVKRLKANKTPLPDTKDS